MSNSTTERETTTLIDLRPETSLGLLTGAVVGRVVHTDGDERLRVPVKHLLHRGTVVFPQPPGDPMVELTGSEVRFEADRYDIDEQTGWTVVVRGHLERVGETLQGALDLPSEVRGKATGEVWLRIVPTEITGRWILPLPDSDDG